jgi:hypothetical protein
MPSDREKVRDAARKLKDAANKLDNLSNTDAESLATERFADVKAKFDALQALFAGAGEEPAAESAEHVRFDKFFSNVGRALVSAQRELDEHSREYIERVRAQPALRHASPTAFRIPKLSADIKFALERTDKEEVGLVFFKAESSRRELHQQSVQFEIVAVPSSLPSEKEAAGLNLRFQATLSPEFRQRVRQVIIEKKGHLTEKQSEDLAIPVLLDNFERVLVFPSKEEQAFLVYAEKGSRNNLGVWHLDLASSELKHVYKYVGPPLKSEFVEPLQELIVEAGQAQPRLPPPAE